MVVWQGVTEDGTATPVQVTQDGKVVAQGLDGPPGEPGPPGPPGQIDLPPDPYEGALLGWLNGELAWISGPPVPIPEGVFGPITAWDSLNGLLTVAGEIPNTIQPGVYVYQCNEQGQLFSPGLISNQLYSSEWTGSWQADQGAYRSFDGEVSDAFKGSIPAKGVRNSWYGSISIPAGASVELVYFNPATGSYNGGYIEINGHKVSTETRPDNSDPANLIYGDVTAASGSEITSMQIRRLVDAGGEISFVALKVNGQTLVDPDCMLNMRVNQIMDDSILGIKNGNSDFLIGSYLKTFPQRVAPWVYYKNDPAGLLK